MHPHLCKSWDIFCRVIDNYGDIGVCWRLARQLAKEQQQQVRLWVDDLDSLVRIWPDALNTNRQQLAGVDVRHWPEAFPTDVDVAQVVIEAFACDIPETYLRAMAAQKHAGTAPTWVNLEYLSAEQWVEDCHAMTSVHPMTGLHKIFFFPGFTPKTGGLLREQNLMTDRDNFDKRLFLNEINVQQQNGSLLISLFAYENPSIASLLESWSSSTQPIHCLVPQGKILASINSLPGVVLASGKPFVKGNLCLEAIPFLTQTQYDQLLWACDINFVRGEDSFVRAQWAGKPAIWHIYPQEGDAHLAKLQAFLSRYCHAMDQDLAASVYALWQSWNRNGDLRPHWNQLHKHLAAWQAASQGWSQELCKQPDLATQLSLRCLSPHG